MDTQNDHLLKVCEPFSSGPPNFEQSLCSLPETNSSVPGKAYIPIGNHHFLGAKC